MDQAPGLQPANAQVDDGDEGIVTGSSDGAAQRRYLTVADGIVASVARGQLSPGDRLPSELARICDTSRTTVRDALLALELFGVVEVRPGSGCYVGSMNQLRRRSSTVVLDSIPRELLDARLRLEPEVARICAGSSQPLKCAACTNSSTPARPRGCAPPQPNSAHSCG